MKTITQHVKTWSAPPVAPAPLSAASDMAALVEELRALFVAQWGREGRL